MPLMTRKLLALSLVTLILSASANVAAVEVAPSPTEQTAPADEPATEALAPAPPPGRFIAHLNVGFVAMNWLGAHGGSGAHTVTVADRLLILQLMGFGYFITPHLRVMLSVQFVELLAGGPDGASTFVLGGAIPWLAWHPWGPFFVGAGPLLAFQSYGKSQLDAGLWTAVGAAWGIGAGFALGAAVQVPITFEVRTAVTVAPAAFVAYRF